MQQSQYPPPETLSLPQRHRSLDRVLASRLARRGWRLEFYTEVNAVLVHGRPVNHLLHLVLTMITGFWAIVWLFDAAFGGQRREAVYIDQHGNVSIRRLH